MTVVARKDLGIKNPFKKLGLALLLMSVAPLIFGSLLALESLEELQASEEAAAGFKLIAAALFLVAGLRLVASGIARVFKFYVGNTIPASLALECAEDTGKLKDRNRLPHYYSLDTIEETMDGKEIEYPLPKSFVDRTLYSLFPRLLLTPPPVRRFAENAFSPFFYSLWIALLFALSYMLALFSPYSFRSDAAFHWLALGFGSLVFLQWSRAFKLRDMILGVTSAEKAKKDKPAKGGDFEVSNFLVLLSLALPIGLQLYDANSELGLPTPPSSLFLAFGAAMLGSLLLFIFSCLLIYRRLPKQNPPFEVSDLRDNLEEDTHPSDLFRIFSQIMLELRTLQIPNRCYVNEMNLSSGIGGSQTAEKGTFEGKVAHETQPLPRVPNPSTVPVVGAAALLPTGVGALLYAAGMWVVFHTVSNISVQGESLGLVSFDANAGLLLAGLFALSFGRKLVVGVAQFFCSELTFRSSLYLFKSNGSFRSTRLTIGGSGLNDSHRSESELIHSSFSVRVLGSAATSSVFSFPGSSTPFDCPRYLIALERADDTTQSILHTVKDYLRKRQKMSTFSSGSDEETVQQFNLLNRQAASGRERVLLSDATPLPLVEDAAPTGPGESAPEEQTNGTSQPDGGEPEQQGSRVSEPQ